MKKLAVLLFLLHALAARTQILIQDLVQGPGSSTPDFEVLSNQTVVFAATTDAYGRELWTTQGSCEQTELLLDIFPGTAGGNPQNLTQIGNLVYFSANDGVHGPELWVTDGTVPGTRMIRDIHAGAFGSEPEMFVKAGDLVYFTAVDAGHGREIWRTNGTEAGTLMVKDVQPGVTWGFGISDEMVAYKDSLFFSVFDYNYGESLWKTAGTLTSTVLVKDYGTGGCLNLCTYGNLLLQTVLDGTHGIELWRSDGSTAGTYLLRDIYPGTGNGLTGSEDFELSGGSLFFSANDGVHGKELWSTDGTAAGTHMVKDVWPGSASSGIFDLETHDGMLYFDANDGIHGRELWKSDGSEPGTQLVKDVRPGNQDGLSSNKYLMGSGEWLFFPANDGTHGNELWQSDGTAAGTQMVIDLEAGSDASDPWRLTDFNGTLLWVATTSNIGTEPYINLPDPMGGPELIVQVDTVQGLTCWGDSDGRIEITVVQGVCPYLFYWSNGATTEDIQNINSHQNGIYSVTVIDAAGHEVVLSDLNVVEPEWLYVTEVEYLLADCYGNLGSVTITGTGGTPPYAFLWNDGFTGDTRVNVPADTYYNVTITDAHGCTRSGGYGFQPNYPGVGDFGDPNIGCKSDTVLLTPRIPTSTTDKASDYEDYVYLWTASNGGAIVGSPDTVPIYVIGPGTFTLVVTDTANGCSSVAVVDVGVDTLKPTATADPDFTVPCSQTDFTIQASYSLNGAEGYPEFSWTFYDGVNDPQLLWNSNYTSILAHYSGNYVFTVVNDQNGCSDSDTVVVAPANLSPPISVTGGMLNCVVAEVTLQAMLGGDNTFFNGWMGPDGFASPEISPVVSSPGGYTAIATDSVNGCSASAWLYVNQNLEMPYVSVFAYGDVLGCDQPTIFLEVYPNIFQAPYTYAWSGPDNFSSAETLVEVNQPGVYTVVTTHLISGCTDVQQVEIFGSSDMVLDVVDLVPAGCPNSPDGSAEIEASGGDGDYTYLWSNGDQDALAENLLPGDYTATVTDGSGCLREIAVTIEGTDTTAPQLTCPPALVVGSCQTTVVYNLPGVEDNCPVEPSSLVQTEGLPSGGVFPVGIVNNRFVYTDPGGLRDSCSFTVEVREAAALQAMASPISCNQGCDGFASLLISGDPPYAIIWSNGATGQEVGNLCAGTYTVTVLDAYGCAYQTSAIFTEPAAISVAVDSISDDIGSQGIGAIYTSAAGGTPPLDIQWTNLATGQTYTGEDINGLTSAYYQCEIIDANDCSYTADSIFVNNLVTTQDVDGTTGTSLYPNPAMQFVNLVYPPDTDVLPNIDVYNITGQRVDVGISAQYPGHLLLNTSKLVPGVYQVRVQLDGKNAMKQLVIAGE